MTNPTVRDVVKRYLIDNHFDGLCFEGYCWCFTADLAPCNDDGIMACQAGHKVQIGNDEWMIKGGVKEV